MRGRLLSLGTCFLAVGMAQPIWEWASDRFLDQPVEHYENIISNIPEAVALIAPAGPYLIGIAIGLFLAALLVPPVRVSTRPAAEPIKLGYRALEHADHVRTWLGNPQMYNDYLSYLSETHFVLLSLRNAGFATPTPPVSFDARQRLDLARRYLVIVGTLLKSGNEMEALAQALSFCASVNATNDQSLFSPRGFDRPAPP